MNGNLLRGHFQWWCLQGLSSSLRTQLKKTKFCGLVLEDLKPWHGLALPQSSLACKATGFQFFIGNTFCSQIRHSLLPLLCTRAVPNILFGPNSRPNSVFIFGRIVLQKIHRIRIIVAMQRLLTCSCIKPRKQALLWAWHFMLLLLVSISTGDSGPQVSINH